MGTIAARDCLLVLELTEQVAAALLIAVRQGIELRQKQNPDFMEENPMSKEATEFVKNLCNLIPFIQGGLPVEPILRRLLRTIQSQDLLLY
jgi:histidine ammonia-lyase